MRQVAVFVLACCVGASATNYYVSSSSGSDSNNGTSQSAPWKTFSATGNHVNSGSFNAGDVIYLKRGDVWNEQLIPPSSGASGNPIQFDAYGTGAAPVITAGAPISFVSGSWTPISGNVWKATVSTGVSAATAIDTVQFGNIYGRHQPYSGSCTSTVVSKYDWCVVWPNVYVYSPAGVNPVTTYAADGMVVPYVDSTTGLAMISVDSRNWLTFQHIKVQGFSYIGVGVTGTSDNLVFANMESDGMLPYGTTPHGFYVSASSAHVQFVNDDAHLNYDGFKISAAAGVTLTNCRAYANRDAGLHDTTGSNPSPVTYGYSHFYGNNIAQFPTGDVSWSTGAQGPIAGSGNIPSTMAPAVVNFARYPARFSFTVDDVGSSDGTEGYVDTLPALFAIHGTGVDKFNVAVVPSYPVNWDDVRTWYAGGNEIDSHSWSHQYYTTTGTPAGTCTLAKCPNAPALKIQYTGSGTAATMTVSGTMLSTNVTGAAGDNISINLANAPYDQMGQTGPGGWGLSNYLNTLPNYSVVLDSDAGVPLVRPNTHTLNLAGTTGSVISITGQDIKTGAFVWTYDQTLLLPDEMRSSKSAIQNNVPGLSPSVYVYPDGIEDPSSEADAVVAGYTAARGSLAMKGQDNASGSANSAYANGVNVQNITSLGAVQIHGMTQAQVNQIAASLVFRVAAWGVPYGLFTHYNQRGDATPDISNTELGWLLDGITANGGVWLTNMGLANAITAGTGFSGSTRYVQNPSGGAVNLAAAQANSPTVGRGVVTNYPVDLNGADRSKLGVWDIGASAYLGQRYGTVGGQGSTRIGGWTGQQGAALPQVWVNSNEWVGTTSRTIAFPSSGSGGAWSCGVTNYGPYTAGSQASLQQAINDAEACRTAGGTGSTITIPAGAVFSGTAGLTLPQTAGDTSTNFIVLQSSTPLTTGQTVCSHGIQDNVAASTQPGVRNLGCNGAAMSYQLGTTVTAVSGAFTLANETATNTSAYNDLASMYTIECTAANCNSLQTGTWDTNNIGPHHFAILNAEIRPLAGATSTSAPVAIGGSETLVSQIPTHIHLAYDYLHGDWTDAPVSGGVATGPPTGANSLPNDIALNCIYCSVSYTYVDRSLRPGAEGHVIALKLSQQLKFVHNWFEGQSSGVFCGGWSAAIPISGFVTCLDGEDRANRYTYPYSWILARDAGFNPNGGSNGYVRKNAHESKFSQRYLFDGNVVENVDNSGAQNGTIMSWKTAQTSSGLGDNYWTVLSDTTVTNNILRNSCNGPNWGANSDVNSGTGGGIAFAPTRALWTNNLLYNVSSNNPACTGATPGYGLRFNGSDVGTTWTASVSRDATGTIATATLTSFAGALQTDMQVGDPVQMSGCTDASFNTTATALGPPALTGTLTNGLTVVYASTGTANATVTDGTCKLNNAQPPPRYFTYSHNSDFLLAGTPNAGGDPQNSASGGTNPYGMFQRVTFTNNVFVGGGTNSTFGEGTRTTTKAYDPTTLVLNNDLFPGRDSVVTCPGHSAGAGGIAACYTEYSATSVASTPATLYGTPTPYCTGNDPRRRTVWGFLERCRSHRFRQS